MDGRLVDQLNFLYTEGVDGFWSCEVENNQTEGETPLNMNMNMVDSVFWPDKHEHEHEILGFCPNMI